MSVILFFVAFQIRRRLCAPAISSDTCVPEKFFACGAQKLLLPLFGTDYLKVTLHVRFRLTKIKLAEKKKKKKEKVLADFFMNSPHREESNAVL